MQKYLDIYPSSITDGVGLIQVLSSLDDIPWKVLADDVKTHLEKTYGMRSGFKSIISALTIADDTSRAKVLSSLFSQKWTKLWNDYMLEYNPLDAYRMDEEYSGTRKTDDTHTDTFGRQVVSNGTDSGTVSNNGTDMTDGSTGIYGFNSSESVPSNIDRENVSSTNTETRNLTDSNTVVNSGSDTRVIDGEEKSSHTLKKSGNIGYSTPQKLLREDIELWINPYFNIVFADIDSFITIQVYE